MAIPSVTVEVGIFNGLRLDDATFGRLDTGVLDGGISYTTVPQGVFGVSSSRGRNRDIGKTSAGTLTVSLRNEDRFFDPIAGSTFASLVKPRLPIRVTADSERVFTGFIDDWDLTYEPGGQSTATIQASDAFSIFARNLNTGGSAVSETTGDRLERVLDQITVNWSATDRDIDTGQSTLAADVLDGDALNYMLNVVEQSELGLLFMSKDGDVAFRSRLLSTTGSAIRFADDGSGIPFAGVEVVYGSEDLINSVTVTGAGGTATAEDSTSQILYGITAEEIDTEVSTLTQQEGIADFVIAKYATPELRVQSVTVELHAMSTAQHADVLGLEIGQQVDLLFTPNRIPPSLSVRSRIIGISHSIGLESHTMQFQLEKLPFRFFVLDSATLGKLDETDVVLGF